MSNGNYRTTRDYDTEQHTNRQKNDLAKYVSETPETGWALANAGFDGSNIAT